MSGTRDKILRTLLARTHCTINDLSQAVEISPISVRHHINSLQADGLVEFKEERHGVGRPRQVYYLTEAGLEQFPTHYVRLTMRLLEQLKETMPQAMIGKIFSQMAEDLARETAANANMQNLSFTERLELVQQILQREGFEIEWEQKGTEYHIRDISCPYYFIGQNHPEICTVGQVLISTILSAPVSQTRCILNGDAHCTYVVSPQKQTDDSI